MKKKYLLVLLTFLMALVLLFAIACPVTEEEDDDDDGGGGSGTVSSDWDGVYAGYALTTGEETDDSVAFVVMGGKIYGDTYYSVNSSLSYIDMSGDAIVPNASTTYTWSTVCTSTLCYSLDTSASPYYKYAFTRDSSTGNIGYEYFGTYTAAKTTGTFTDGTFTPGTNASSSYGSGETYVKVSDLTDDLSDDLIGTTLYEVSGSTTRSYAFVAATTADDYATFTITYDSDISDTTAATVGETEGMVVGDVVAFGSSPGDLYGSYDYSYTKTASTTGFLYTFSRLDGDTAATSDVLTFHDNTTDATDD